MSAGPSLHASLEDAAKAVAEVVRGRSLSQVLSEHDELDTESPRAALIDLTHGTLRCYGRMQGITRALAQRGGTAAPLLEALLWCAIYALDAGRHAHYTVVDQAVRAAASLGFAAAKGYVNAVLRRYLRERAALEARLGADAEFRWCHPRWWIDALQAEWPSAWQGALEAGNGRPPMTLRVNRRRTDVARSLARLAEAGIAATQVGDSAILLGQPVPVARLPGFAEGEVSVQDAGAQLAAPLLGLAEGMRVLDACAAPGGKAAHLLETADIALTALDTDARRCRLIDANLARLGLAADVREADCTVLGAWWDGRRFDRIIADVPCSGSGVARRHPDIKWLRRRSDLPGFARRQGAILDALWQALATDGKLLYVTCSVFPEENNAVVEAFCQRTPSARRLALPGGAPAQLLPAPGHDGFHFALLGRGS
jgi:16S rRNA (cytosine967-C5)-methyltransferase